MNLAPEIELAMILFILLGIVAFTSAFWPTIFQDLKRLGLKIIAGLEHRVQLPDRIDRQKGMMNELLDISDTTIKEVKNLERKIESLDSRLTSLQELVSQIDDVNIVGLETRLEKLMEFVNAPPLTNQPDSLWSDSYRKRRSRQSSDLPKLDQPSMSDKARYSDQDQDPTSNTPSSPRIPNNTPSNNTPNTPLNNDEKQVIIEGLLDAGWTIERIRSTLHVSPNTITEISKSRKEEEVPF